MENKKKCKACGIEKGLNEFHKGSWGEFGRVSRCMKCIKDNVNIPKEKPITETDCRNEALKYSNRTDFRKFALKYLNKAKEFGILDELFTKRPLKYTLEECKNVAKNCKDYVDFRENFNSYYQFCRVNDLLKEIQKVLPVKKVKKRGLTQEDIFEIASQYNSKSEFYNGDGTAYNYANNMGILNELIFIRSCENNKKRCNFCNECKDFENFTIKNAVCKKCRNKKDMQKKVDDPLFKLKSDMRSRILHIFSNKGLVKNGKTCDILCCSFEKFKKHIESQFENWMSWENKGNACETLEPNCSWDLDHIIPLSFAKTEEEIYLFNHWSNFQPLCSYKNRNIKKGNINPLTNLELKITLL
jgi:hypothetical protein